jgi:hypothetical protein
MVLVKLLGWGAASVDKTPNHPVLPHAIIVFNATENVSEREWDAEYATNLLLTEISGAVSREPALREYVRQWKKRGREITSTVELLNCYYATVTVMRMLARGAYMLMDRQATKLHDLIKTRCTEALTTKKEFRMLANSERLQTYLQAAFDHFMKDLNVPFDFVKEALKHSPAPCDFQGNILGLAASMQRHMLMSPDGKRPEDIFTRLAKMVASCIMLDAVRQDLMGAYRSAHIGRGTKSPIDARNQGLHPSYFAMPMRHPVLKLYRPSQICMCRANFGRQDLQDQHRHQTTYAQVAVT